VVDNTGDSVIESAGEGTDLVQSRVTYTLAAEVENLTLTGTSAINATGNALNNFVTGNSANNTLTGNAGDDWLDGGSGSDTMRGGTGNDTYVVAQTGDVVTENANEGTDTVRASITYTLGANVENLMLTGTSTLNGTGNTLDNVLTGNSANNSLTGNAGADALDGGAGTDTLTGGTGNDTYLLGRGYGADTVAENDATSGNSDVARFLAGVAHDQIWFLRSGNNLEASIIGTGDKFVLSNWYLGSQYRVEQLNTVDSNRTLLESNVQNLVNAMAAFAPPPMGQTTLTAEQQAALAPVIASNWQ
jgi:Ca2+-binding RTX toxin-like protein